MARGKKSVELPPELLGLPSDPTFEEVARFLLEMKGVDVEDKKLYFVITQGWRASFGGAVTEEYYWIRGNNITRATPGTVSNGVSICNGITALSIYHVIRDYNSIMLYVDGNGGCWSLDCSGFRYVSTGNDYEIRGDGGPIAWEPVKKLLGKSTYIRINPMEETEAILQRKSPYAYRFYKEHQFELTPEALLMAPHIEQVGKSGFAIGECQPRDASDAEKWNRVCKPGTDPRTIFKVSKDLRKVLVRESNLSVWDHMRKMEKLAEARPYELQDIYDKGFQGRDLRLIEEILKCTYNDKRIFTWTSLMTYLEKLNMFEAITEPDALCLLRDYLYMCKQVGTKPRIDSDSLKREHDVMARLVRERRDEAIAKKLDAGCQYLAEKNYYEGVFFIRGCEGYDDLIDEARQQHNCVASYAMRIANKESHIYFMREVAHPDRSLITVELSNDGKYIRQKLMAFNRKIRNKAQSDFLERWVKAINTPGYIPNTPTVAEKSA